jgi:hypothetical protein
VIATPGEGLGEPLEVPHVSSTLSTITARVISILPFLARRHPAWCLAPHPAFPTVHHGPTQYGQSPTLNTEGLPVMHWHVAPISSTEHPSPLVYGALSQRSDDPRAQRTNTLVAIAAADARAFALDLLRVVALIEAAA